MTPAPTTSPDLARAGKRASALPADERRSRIVDATLPLLLENGDMVTTRQIAEAAGIAEGTIFRVFADKDAVIAAVVEKALDPAPLELALEAIDLSQPLEKCVELAIVTIQQRVVDVWRLVTSVGTRFYDRARRPPDVSNALVSLFAAHRKELTVPPLAAARLLRALTLSVANPVLVEEPMTPRQLAKLFLYGVHSRRSSC